ncbi:hypothetical protein E4T38_06699 [Aureobasidium subglaciale]|nr:hypothetical protein E4T38_06699 [Aureobasidium subglaciale]KAI5222444.1 hypothetical protein E4T41_06550 [Aureobasidium subglaciale]KAI5223302.1 hypothetical protein E4T40_04466 [Aureobasidium subglaciale]KAI5259929.1 hypothetical protein E4T46_06437 [Aureobasidium subglaciale]
MNSNNGTDTSSGTGCINRIATISELPAKDGLPFQPRLTPAFGLGGAILLLTGLAYAVLSIRIKRLFLSSNPYDCLLTKYHRLHASLSCALFVSLCVTVLVIFARPEYAHRIDDATQGGYLVAIILPSILLAFLSQKYCVTVSRILGCFLGGFCFCMWLEVLSPGGVISSSNGLAILIMITSVAGCVPLYFQKTRDPALIISSAFSGATALVLGIDCFSRAGLKEFWVYTWHLHRDEIFGYEIPPYPMTRLIKVEIGLVPVLFLLGLLSQIKFYIPIRARKQREAIEAAQLREIEEQRDAETSREFHTKNQKRLNDWEKRHAEKKKPGVELTQISPVSPLKQSRRARAFAKITPKSLTRTRGVTTEMQQRDDEILPVEASRDDPDAVVQPQHPSSPHGFRSLRPKSFPPPPIVSQSDGESRSSSDGIDYVNVGSESPRLPYFGDRVSSLGLPLDLEDAEVNMASELPDFENGASAASQRSRKDEDPEPAVTQVFAQNSGFEQDALQNSHAGQADVSKQPLNQEMIAEVPQDSTNVPQGLGATDSTGSLGRAVFSKLSAMEAQKEGDIMERTSEWRKTLALAQRASLSTIGDEPSLWFGFEGTHAAEIDAEQLDGQGLVISNQPQHVLARTGARKRPKSQRASIVDDTPAILPTAIESARVRERNSTLPMLETGSSLLDRLTTTSTQKTRVSALVADVHVAQEESGVERRFSKLPKELARQSPDSDDMTLAQKRKSLIDARRMSASQVSTEMSYAPRASSSMDCQSPAHTTARTTPATSSPSRPYAQPVFAKVAHPLRGAYPMPPCEPFHPLTSAAKGTQWRESIGPSTYDGMMNHAYLEDKPAPAIQKNGIRSPPVPRRQSVPVHGASVKTLFNQIEQAEVERHRGTDPISATQMKTSADAARDRSKLEKRRRSMQATEMMMGPRGQEIHQAHMRKMQRQAQV